MGGGEMVEVVLCVLPVGRGGASMSVGCRTGEKAGFRDKFAFLWLFVRVKDEGPAPVWKWGGVYKSL